MRVLWAAHGTVGACFDVLAAKGGDTVLAPQCGLAPGLIGIVTEGDLMEIAVDDGEVSGAALSPFVLLELHKVLRAGEVIGMISIADVVRAESLQQAAVPRTLRPTPWRRRSRRSYGRRCPKRCPHGQRRAQRRG